MWNHTLTADEYRSIHKHSYPKLVVHGRSDVIVPHPKGERLARLINAEWMSVDAGHMPIREVADEINRRLDQFFDSLHSNSKSNGSH